MVKVIGGKFPTILCSVQFQNHLESVVTVTQLYASLRGNLAVQECKMTEFS